MNVSLIITTYNRYDALELVLNSIENQKVKPYELIIADDGSDQMTKENIKKYIKKSSLNIIHSWQEDIGFRLARSRNRAIGLSKGEYIVIIDGDMILDSNFIADHIFHAKKHQFIQGSRVLLTEEKTLNLLRKGNISLSFFSKGISNRKNAIRSRILSKIFSFKSKNIHGTRGCNMSFFKEDCIAVNGFNNEFEGWGREDSEFVMRFLNSGFRKLNLRFAAIQFHLWHGKESNKSLPKNDEILNNTISKKLSWCPLGLNEFLN